MYNLHLTAEQLEIRETVRDFVLREINPVVLHPDRLQEFNPRFPLELLDQASQMGLRTLALSEESGGAGADSLTSCIVMEELAAGDADVAAALAQTSLLGHVLFEQAMTPAQRARFLPQFVQDGRYHLAFAGHDPDADLGWSYHRPRASETSVATTAVRQSNGEWVVNGVTGLVANAPIAKLFAVQVKSDPEKSGMNGVSTLLVPRDTPGLTVREPDKAGGGSGGESMIRWYHGTGGKLVFKDCQVPSDHRLGNEGPNPFTGGAQNRQCGVSQWAAINLGVGRAAYEAAVDYAKLRIQGGRHIIEHQSIGTILADIAVKLEVARNMIWKAAWASDHPDAVADRSLPDLPLQTIARIFTSEVVREVTEGAAECFGAMGVMRDMPLQKYVHDALVFLYAEESNSAAKLRIAETVAGYQRPAANAA